MAGGWTLLYWGWWLSWSPFVGMFIARVSRGRTIREFVTGVLFVPAGFTLMWMTVFGNSAIYLIMNRGPQTSPILFSRMWRWPCLISGAFPVLFRAVIHRNGDGHRLLCHVC